VTTPEIVYEDSDFYRGKRMRIEREGEIHRGMMVGIAKNSLIAIGHTQGVKPWVLQLDDGTTRLFIPGPWKVELTTEPFRER
jgi:hypothetical protein